MRFLNHILRVCALMLLLVPANSSGPTKVYAQKTPMPPAVAPVSTLLPPTVTNTPKPKPTATQTAIQTPTPTATLTTYTVKPGDSLTKIAEEFGIPVAYLAYNNQIYDPDLIFEGQVLDLTKPNENNPIPNVAGKLILVKLSEQKVYVYENNELIKTFVVSTGLSNTPTVTGTYYVYAKHTTTPMTGPGYNIPNVPWTMYFYQGYGLHGAYWHNNFGQPMSHGCVNMRVDDAEWLFYWAPMYTTVTVED